MELCTPRSSLSSISPQGQIISRPLSTSPSFCVCLAPFNRWKQKFLLRPFNYNLCVQTIKLGETWAAAAAVGRCFGAIFGCSSCTSGGKAAVLSCHKPDLDRLDQQFQATCLLPVPLINLSNIDNFSTEIFWNRTWGCWVRRKYASSLDPSFGTIFGWSPCSSGCDASSNELPFCPMELGSNQGTDVAFSEMLSTW